MWLFVIQVIALIAASIRGWGSKPIIMYGLLLAFSFVAGAVVGPDAMSCLQVVDYIIVGVFIVMAIIGKEKEQKNTISKPIGATSEPRIKCPHCAEWILPDANICRYCSREINNKTNRDCGSVLSEESKRNDEYYYKLGLIFLKAEKYDEAKENFFKAIEVSSPNSKWYSYSKAILLELKSKAI